MKFPKTKKIEKKTRTSEARRRYAQSKLVLEFLLKTQTEKDRQLRILSSELSMLNVDIARVNQRIKIVENDFFDSNQIAGTIKDDFSPELTGISLDPNVPVLQDDALFDSQPTPKRHTTGKILERSVVSNSSDKTLVPSAEILNNQSAITQCTPPVTFDFHKHMAGLQSCYFDSSFGQCKFILSLYSSPKHLLRVQFLKIL